MDRKKVIKALEVCRDQDNPPGYRFTSCKDDCPYYKNGCARKLKEDSAELLKEQEEPKKIVRKQCKKEHDDGSIDYFAEWYCPHCNMLILRGFSNPSIKFCYKCGKPILWEGQ